MTETMKSWPVYNNIPVKDIEVGERLRPLDPKEVDRKVESIREVGLLQPITVSQHPTKKEEELSPSMYSRRGCIVSKRARCWAWKPSRPTSRH